MPRVSRTRSLGGHSVRSARSARSTRSVKKIRKKKRDADAAKSQAKDKGAPDEEAPAPDDTTVTVPVKKSKGRKGKLKVASSQSLGTSIASAAATAPSLPNLTKYEKAPEIAHLKIKKLTEDHDKSETNTLLMNSNLEDNNVFACCCAKGEFDDLDPVYARARHSVDFVHQLSLQGQEGYEPKKTKSKKKQTEPVESVPEDPASLALKTKGFKAIYDGLQNLNSAVNIYKQLTILLTFTKHVPKPLTNSEIELTSSKTVIGCYVWLATYILQQMQYDHEVNFNGYSHRAIEDCVSCMERLAIESIGVWSDVVAIAETVEKVHLSVERVFTNLFYKYAKEQNANVAFRQTRHLRVHSNFQARAEKLEKLKEFEATGLFPTTPPGKTGVTFLSPLRILWRDEAKDMGHVNKGWQGFDVLPQGRKFGYLKWIFAEVSTILSTVWEQLDVISKLIDTPANDDAEKDASESFTPLSSEKKEDASSISSFHSGVNGMDKCFLELNRSWTQKEIFDFHEVEKIVLDNLDLLTLGTATIRALLHDCRHLIFICYELSRSFEFSEFHRMLAYKSLVKECVKEGVGEKKGIPKQEIMKLLAQNRRDGQSFFYKKRSSFADEEKDMDPEDYETLFEHSVYQEIIKDIPINVHDGDVELTLQEVESVFSKSSTVLLSYTSQMSTRDDE